MSRDDHGGVLAAIAGDVAALLVGGWAGQSNQKFAYMQIVERAVGA